MTLTAARLYAQHSYGVNGGILSISIAAQASANFDEHGEALSSQNACRDAMLTQTQGPPQL